MIPLVLPSLRIRLALLLVAAVAMILGAALTLTWALSATNEQVESLASAQRRVELLSALSQRVGDYGLVALQAAEQPGGSSDSLAAARARVEQGFARLDRALAGDAAGNEEATERALTGGRSRILAQMRARFEVLDRQVGAAVADMPPEQARATLNAALDLFAAGFGPALSDMIEQERIAAQSAQAATSRLADRLEQGAILAAIATLLLAILLYRAIARPLLRRISQVASGAAAIAEGRLETRLPVRGNDELSRAMDGFNRMAAQLAEREAELLAAQRRLQEIVEERTAELRDANQRLAGIDQARRRFFTDVSHELRTPLTVILGEAELSLRGSTSGGEVTRSLQTIRNRAQRLHRRVEDLLRIARSETGQIDLDVAELSLAPLLEEAREGTKSLASRASVEVVLTEVAPIAIEGDREWLRQVVEGLLVNAIRHSRAGAEVRLSAHEQGGGVAIEVCDSGSGIAPEDRPRIFERFYRGRAGREGEGFGIGLALAKWVIERHGGSIDLDSNTTPGASGTRVTLHLPRHIGLDSAAAQ